MARKARAEVEGGLYHVITRGNNRRRIFNSPADYQKFLSLLAMQKAKLSFFLYAYCLMTNHVNLLLERQATSGANLIWPQSGAKKVARRETSGIVGNFVRALEVRKERSWRVSDARSPNWTVPDVSRLATFFAPLRGQDLCLHRLVVGGNTE